MQDSLQAQRASFLERRFLAMPIAGAIAWTAIGTCGLLTTNPTLLSLTLFVASGTVFYLALGVARVTGERLLIDRQEWTVFDTFFLHGIVQANAALAVAIPFFLVDPTSLPMTLGILSGLIWIAFSACTGHWIGYAHAAVRTALVLALWYLLPEHRYVAIPFAIVAVYLVSIAVLAHRYRSVATDRLEPAGAMLTSDRR